MRERREEGEGGREKGRIGMSRIEQRMRERERERNSERKTG